jgi:hypothetical protein
MIVYVILGLLVAAFIVLNIVGRIQKKSNVPTPWIEPTDKSTNPNSHKENPHEKIVEPPITNQ